jgi:transposase
VDFDPVSITTSEAHYEEMLGGELSVIGIMALRGVGRRRAEQLRARGFRSPRQLLTAPPR